MQNETQYKLKAMLPEMEGAWLSAYIMGVRLRYLAYYTSTFLAVAVFTTAL